MSDLVQDYIRASESYPPLNLQLEIELSQKIQDAKKQGNDNDPEIQECVNWLVLGNFRFLLDFLRTQNIYPGHKDFELRLSDVLIGTIKAAWRYNPIDHQPNGKPGRFVSFAQYWMRRIMLETIYDNRGVKISQQMRTQLREYRQYCSKFLQDFGYEPTPEDIEKHTGINLYNQALIQDMTTDPLSLQETYGDHDTPLYDMIPDDSFQQSTQENIVDQEDLHAAMQTLPVRLRRLIQYQLGFLDGMEMSDAELAREFGIVRQHVPGLVDRAHALLLSAMVPAAPSTDPDWDNWNEKTS